jgi:hypothetical protein
MYGSLARLLRQFLVVVVVAGVGLIRKRRIYLTLVRAQLFRNGRGGCGRNLAKGAWWLHTRTTHHTRCTLERLEKTAAANKNKRFFFAGLCSISWVCCVPRQIFSSKMSSIAKQHYYRSLISSHTHTNLRTLGRHFLGRSSTLFCFVFHRVSRWALASDPHRFYFN